MRYLGGKSRIARRMAKVINAERQGALLWDPFCGGLSMAAALGPPIICSDVHAGLINLYRAVQADPGFLDWIPELTADDYAFAKTLPAEDPVAAFVGFGLSFRGQWFRGLAEARAVRPGGPVYSMLDSSRNRVKADVAAAGASFTCQDFMHALIYEGVHMYLDPPYRGTQGYAGVPPFDHDAFELRVCEWADAGAVVWVSEYDFPVGEVVWEAPRRMSGVSRKGEQPMERLYRIGPK